MSFTRILFYLLLLLLPTQLGRHFFFDFSLIEGVRVDYLAPTVHVTDIVIILLLAVWCFELYEASLLKPGKWWSRKSSFSLLVAAYFIYLLTTSVFIAENSWAAGYKWIKITEFSVLGYSIYRIRPKLDVVIFLLSVGVGYSSILAIGQFMMQHSLGGFFWYIGERTFVAATPGIAAANIGGALVLRPYATFPHPNVLAGFLAIAIPLILSELQKPSRRKNKMIVFWYVTCVMIGITALGMTFSRLGVVVASIGFLTVFFKYKTLPHAIVQRTWLTVFGMTGLLLCSIVVFYAYPVSSQSVFERKALIDQSIQTFMSQPIFGTGLLNSIGASATSPLSRVALFSRFQPVHNVYLLMLVETGVAGFLLFMLIMSRLIHRFLKTDPRIRLVVYQLFLIGLFDHYLATLQQGLLIATLFLSLAALSFPQKMRTLTNRNL